MSRTEVHNPTNPDGLGTRTRSKTAAASAKIEDREENKSTAATLNNQQRLGKSETVSESETSSVFNDMPGLEGDDENRENSERLNKSTRNIAIMPDLLNPGTFAGEGHEDGELWWSAVLPWLKLRGLRGDMAVESVGLLLKGNARRWYNALPNEDKADISGLADAFALRYCLPKSAWSEKVALFECKQLVSQSVADYLQIMEIKSEKSGATADQVVAAIINGLLPHIKQQIIMNQQRLQIFASGLH